MTAAVRVGFLTTCIADMLRPQLAEAAVSLIRECGHEPLVPRSQTCCGQPALNAGRRSDAKKLARKMADEFSHCDTVVAPSGSCVGAVRVHMPKLFAEDEPGHDEVLRFASKCRELSQFLTDEGFEPKAGRPLRVAYHDSCAGLRELGVRDGPRDLLRAAGHELVPMADEDVCCGFGGAFSVKFAAVSARMADDKCACAVATDADVLAMGDMGCVLNIDGRMGRRGGSMPVCHFAELLAGTAP